MMQAVSIGATARVLVLVLAGRGGPKKAEEGESAGKKTTIAGLSASDHGSKRVSGTTEVELDDFYFDPTVLKGKPGAKVTLTLKNEGKVKHNFDLDAQNIDSGKSAAVTIPKSGQLSFFCKYHKSAAMAGALAASG